ncbi:MAG: single-stranded-DNA-specific exonuclease RecJ [Deltaproteobacteria bacterium]|nr:single-stranded-DNA-specific exonuclease RecJ [Deltaproteobacteria bacterium]
MQPWQVFPSNPELCQQLANQVDIMPLTAQLLINRGLCEPESIRKFLAPSLAHLFDPFLLADMEKAGQRLVTAIRQQETITVYGDYDVDGTTGTALLVAFLQSVGAKVNYYIPHRLTEGYSLNETALKKLQQAGTRVMITVDNGIRANAEASLALALGVDLIITDHHELGDELPLAYAVINPKRHTTGPGQELAGVGVAFVFLMALRKVLRESGYFTKILEPNLKEYLDLVAIGTIADLCPLIGVNRVLAKLGLQQIAASKRPGVKALCKVSNIGEAVHVTDVAYRIGPRINAVGRLSEASFGVRLLLTKDEAEALALADQLDAENQKRKQIEGQITADACAKIESTELHHSRQSLVVHDPAYHSGVVGIVASRIVERYGRPAIVLAEEGSLLKGSARSVRGLNIVEALRACAPYLERFGGHAMAAGLTLLKENFTLFYGCFDAQIKQQLNSANQTVMPGIKVDATPTSEEINWRLMQELQTLQPFGQGNPEPLLAWEKVTLRYPRIVGEKHVKGRVENQGQMLEFIGFNLATQDFSVTTQKQIIFCPEINRYQGQKSIQLVIKHIFPHS